MVYFFSCFEYVSDEFNTANALGKGPWKTFCTEAGVLVPEFSLPRA